MDKYVNEVGVVLSAVLATLLVTWVWRRVPGLQDHLNDRPGLKVGSWWRGLIGLFVPLVLGYMLVSGLVTLITDGYGGYPGWFTTAFGWGAIVVVIVAAVVMSRLRWRRDPDEFVPEALPGAERPAGPTRPQREDLR